MMGKITHLDISSCDPVQFMLDTIKVMPDDTQSLMIAIRSASGEWIMGYSNVGFNIRAEGIAHMQCDLIDSMIRANSERYGLHTHEED